MPTVFLAVKFIRCVFSIIAVARPGKTQTFFAILCLIWRQFGMGDTWFLTQIFVAWISQSITFNLIFKIITIKKMYIFTKKIHSEVHRLHLWRIHFVSFVFFYSLMLRECICVRNVAFSTLCIMNSFHEK